VTAIAIADPHRGLRPSLRRIRALILRHAFLLARSWPRMLSMAYYPTVTMVLWAFVTIYLAPTNRFLTDAPGLFIGAVLFALAVQSARKRGALLQMGE
jgi:ABC-2 type transport system permease protein